MKPNCSMVTLFTDEFPIINTQNELEIVQKKFNNYDPYYVTSGCIKDRREWIDYLWNLFGRYADSHFLRQYKNNFHKRTWEMYVGCILLNNEMQIESFDEGPDFIVDSKEYVECVAVERGDPTKPNSVPPVEISTLNNVKIGDNPVDQMILRMTSAIKDKLLIYKNCKLIDKTKPFIIAVNTAQLEHIQDYIGIPLIIKALFGINFLQIHQDRRQDFSWRSSIKKEEQDIPVNIFTNDSCKEISGIIFSDKLIINRSEKIGEDCIFINNPNAINQVESNRYSFMKNWRADGNTINKLY